MSAAELSPAKRFSAHLRQFIERGTPAAWRALVGAVDREADRARLYSGAVELREKLLRLRAELEAYATQVEELFEAEGYPPPWPEEGVEESAENRKLRDRERALDHQAGVFDASQVWHRFTIDGESDSAATVRIQLPRTSLYVFLFRGASEGPHSPARFRQCVTVYRRAIDDCLDTLDAGFSIDPERR